MGDTDTDMIHRLHSSLCTSSSSIRNFINSAQFSMPFSDSGKRFGVPPTSPYSQIPKSNATHSRSISQPSSFFSFDSSLPPLSPSPSSSRAVVVSESLPPRKSHRRSSSDIPTDWSKAREAVEDDVFSAYMNLDVLNSSEPDDSRASGTKTNNGSDDTEGDISSVNESGNHLKRRAVGGDIAPTSRHYRSVSVDSCFMENLSSFGEEDSLKPGTVSPTNSGIEFKNGEFTAVEMKKIMANDKLAEMAMSDPKRVKRILANRQSAARSKERKMRYIVELEHKVQTLQTEATTLSTQFTLLQRDMMGLTNQNNELKFRLQSMEQQAHLRDALNEALNGEVQRLKLAIGETGHNEADRSKMQSLNAEMFQQLNISQSHQQNQNGTMSAKPESNE